MPRLHRAIALVVTIAVASSASAQPATDDATRARALELFRASDARYKTGEFEEAAQLLRASYDLYPEPLILYNLGRALEGMGDFAGAVEQYDRYLATATDIPDRGAIERRIATLRAQLATDHGPGPTTPTSVPITDTTPPRKDIAPAPRRRWLPLVIAGSGVVLVGVGGVLGVMSDSRHDDAVNEPIQAEAKKLQDRAERLATTANVMFVIGGAATLGGIVWSVVQWRYGRRSTPTTAAKAGASRLVLAPTYIGIEWTLP